MCGHHRYSTDITTSKIFCEAGSFGPTFRRAYMYGTNVPPPQTGSLGSQPLQNGAAIDGGIEDGDYHAYEVSFTRQPLMDRLSEADVYGGSTACPSQPPGGTWNPKHTTQYYIQNIYTTRQTPEDGCGSILYRDTHLPSPDNTPSPYQQHPSPLISYPSNNHTLPPSSPISPGIRISADARGLAGQPLAGPSLSNEDWEEYQRTGIVPMHPSKAETRNGTPPEIIVRDGLVTSPTPWNRSGTENDRVPFRNNLPLEHPDNATTLFAGPYDAAMRCVQSPGQPGLSLPSLNYANGQSATGILGVASHGGFTQDNVLVNPVPTEDQTVASRFPSNTLEPCDGRGSSSSATLQLSSWPSNRAEEIRQATIDLERYCQCKYRTKKPLRHWEDQCPFNPNKRQRLFCDIPGCTNREGFPNPFNLRRHKETASCHKIKK